MWYVRVIDINPVQYLISVEMHTITKLLTTVYCIHFLLDLVIDINPIGYIGLR